MLEITFGFVKPHAYENRDAIGRMITDSGLEILQTKDPYLFTREKAAEFYDVHRTQPFFAPLVDSITSGGSALYIVGGSDALNRLSRLAGPTDPLDADPWTIRGMYGGALPNNAFHRSDSHETVRREIGLTFSPEELMIPDTYLQVLSSWPISISFLARSITPP